MGRALTKQKLQLEQPPWLTRSARLRLGAGTYPFSFPGPVRRVFRKKKPTKPSIWAPKYRVVHKSVFKGPWKNEVNPPAVGIMDASFHPSVRKIIVCKGPQTGLTEAAITCIDFVIDTDPGDAIFLYPNEKMAAENCEDRLQPSLFASPMLRKYLTGNRDDLSKHRVKLTNMDIYMAWAHSPASMANRPARYVVVEEPDKYPEVSSKKETSPIRLIEARVTTFPDDHKIWMFSSPSVESGPIWQALTTEAQVIFEYVAVCPVCGAGQVMIFDGIKKPKQEKDPERIEAEKLSWYECEENGCTWNDAVRNRAIAGGHWRAKHDGRELFEYLRAENPGKIGFHYPSWLSRFVSLSKVMAQFRRGLADKTEMKDFMNKHKAEPWLDYTQNRKEDYIYRLKDERPWGLVPGKGEVSCLIGSVDTQDNCFYYKIIAYGFGIEMPCWLVRHGRVETFAALEKILFNTTYPDASNTRYHVYCSGIDALGHRTAEVYDFCRRWPGRIFPVIGRQRLTQPYSWSNIDFYPGTKKPFPGGTRRLTVDSTFYKNALASKLEINPEDPGAYRLHTDIDENYARQMLAEYIDEKGLWQCKKNVANHYWDCAYINLMIADMVGVKTFRQQSEKSETGRQVRSKGVAI